MRTIAALIMVGMLTTACSNDSTGPSEALNYAAAAPTCGPTDATAVEVLLSVNPIKTTQAESPYVRVVINRSIANISGRSWTISNTGAEAAAAYFTNDSTSSAASSGSVSISSVSSANTIEGTVDLHFANGVKVVKGFKAPWTTRQLLCG